MGAGHQFEIDSMRETKKTVHPAWAAVGCFSLVGLTTAGYFLGEAFLRANSDAGWIPLPPEFAWPPENPYLIIKLAMALFTFLFGTAVFSIVYTLIHPPKPGKFDVIEPSIFPPPPRRMK